MTRKWWIWQIIGLTLLIGVSWGYDLYKVATQLPLAIIKTDGVVEPLVSQLLWRWQPVGWMIRTFGTQEMRAADEFVTGLPTFFGLSGKRHYVVLFQNNMELRPTGGFMGSYADIWFERGKLTSLTIQDIYVPDGQIKGYVVEPIPIKQYLFNNDHPGWRLRDANWNPDFPTATNSINWFFKEGGLLPVDGYIAIDLWPIVGILSKTGPLELTDYQGVIVTADSFYHEAQRHAEVGFFPGSTQKRDFLGSVGKQLIERLMTQPTLVARLLPNLVTYLREKHISIFIPNTFGVAWRTLGWDGSLRTSDTDYLMIVEANLGMTKANCCIDRTLVDRITIDATSAAHQLLLTYVNRNPPQPQPPIQWGGGYKDYLRIFIPSTASVSGIFVNQTELSPEAIDIEYLNQKQSVGFLVLTEGGQQSTVTVHYRVPIDKQDHYSLFFQKQPGIEGWPSQVIFSDTSRMVTKVSSGLWRTDTIITE